MGLAAAWLQPRDLSTGRPDGFVVYWTAIAVGGGLRRRQRDRLQLRRPRAMPSSAGDTRARGRSVPAERRRLGPAIAVCFAHLSAALVPLLPGLWAICFGIGVVRLAAVPAAGERVGRALLLRRGVHAAVDRARTRAAHRWWVGGDLRRRAIARGAGALVESRADGMTLQRSKNPKDR